MTEQNRNKTSSIKYKGECAKDASFRFGGTENLVQKRIKRGWEVKKAFITPVTITAKHYKIFKEI